MSSVTSDDVREAILALAQERGPDRSFCPSEVARRLPTTHWREWMPAVRRQARQLAVQGLVVVTQRGRTLSTQAEWRGAIRLQASSDETRDE